MSDDTNNLPWTVRNCGNPDHGKDWECHRVYDSNGRTLLRSVTKDTAETFASVPVLKADNAALLGAITAFHQAWKTGRDTLALAAMLRLAREPHPGAALLEELRTLREALNGVAEVLLGEKPIGVMPSTTLDAAKAQRERVKAARDEALEEAARLVDVEAQESHTREAASVLDDVSARIRAMTSAPKP